MTLSGTNWDSGEAISVFVNDNIGNTWSTTIQITADSSGAFTTSFRLPSTFVAEYRATATGSSGRVATVTFTDAPRIVVSNPEGQGKTGGVLGGFTGGNISTYQELDTINFRIQIDNLAPQDPCTNANPCDGTIELKYTGQEAACLFFDNYFVLNPAGFPLEQLSGTTLPTITQQSGPTVSGTDWSVVLRVQWTSTGSVRQYFQLKLSGNAGECSGSSQHVAFGTGTGDVKDPGNKSVNIPANDVIELPEIFITKKIDRNGDGTFAAGEIASAGEYKFCLDGSTTNCLLTNASGQVTFNNVTPNGAHSVTEEQVNFTQGTYGFVSGVNGGNCTFSGATATATVTSGQQSSDATCTFNNAPGRLEVKKVVTPNPSTDPGRFNLQIDGATTGTGGNVGNNGTTGKQVVTVGTHTVGETAAGTTNLNDYAKSIECKNNGGSGSIVASGIGASLSGVPTPAGSDIVCTITNSRNQGTIQLKKVWSGGAGNATLKIGTTAGGSEVATGTANGANGETAKTTVATGTYFVSETVTGDYSAGLVCFNDANDDGTFNAGDSSITPGANNSVTVGTGGHTLCTFTNTRNTGTIIVKKETLPDGNTTDSFTFDPSWSATNFSLKDGGSNNSGTLPTGTYSVSEVSAPSGWDLLSATCTGDDDGTSPSSIVLDAGETVTCTFTNEAPPSITVLKSNDANGNTVYTDSESINEPGGPVSFQVTVTNTSVEAVTLSSLMDSVYGDLDKDSAAASHSWTTSLCDTGGSIAAGGNYTCTFTAPVSGTPSSTHTDTVTATASDGEGHSPTATDTSTVTIADVASAGITVTKDGSPASLPEPGGDFTFSVNV
ncbi:MAG: hypothetical protein WAT66_12030, partial [Actinomycetota bacterium]